MSNFLNNSEKLISDEFIQKGYIIKDASNFTTLNILQDILVEQSSKIIGKSLDLNNIDWLNNIHEMIEVNQLNNFRLQLIESINKEKQFREHYYKYTRHTVKMSLALRVQIHKKVYMPLKKASLHLYIYSLKNGSFFKWILFLITKTIVTKTIVRHVVFVLVLDLVEVDWEF